MKKGELTKAVREALGEGASKQAAENAIAAVLNAIVEGVKEDGSVQIAGFGTFKLRHRAARMGRNLQTGEPMPIKASKSIGFTPSAVLKKSL
jgi:DNA-binding protein HU-beta